jgi:hypothetical protein
MLLQTLITCPTRGLSQRFLDGSNGADVEFVNLSANDGKYGIVAMQLKTPTGSVILD